MFWLMRKRSTNAAALRERAREVGVRVPAYALGSATADATLPEPVRDAGREIAKKLVQPATPVPVEPEDGEPDGAAPDGSGSGRSESDPKVISLRV
jgi:hypothetical protein